jgi:hypothetical protein
MMKLTLGGIVLSCILVSSAAPAQTDVSSQAAPTDVIVRNVAVDDGVVTGIVENRSSLTVRDVRLLIRHTWLWKNERDPGENNPGRADYHTITDDIPPGQITTFTYRPLPPLPVRTDGRFDTSVEVVGFVEVGE